MVTIVRQISDEIDVGDNTVYYSRHQIDTIPVSESITTGLIHKRTFQDTITLSDLLVRRLMLKRLAQDTITKSESIHIVGQEQTYTVNVQDTIQLLESIIALKTELRKEIHPEQPFYPRIRRSRFQKRFEYMRL
jgi:hypothetical protein